MLQKKNQTNKTKLLRWDSHSQCKSAGVAKQRSYDHRYVQWPTGIANVWYIRCTWCRGRI